MLHSVILVFVQVGNELASLESMKNAHQGDEIMFSIRVKVMWSDGRIFYGWLGKIHETGKFSGTANVVCDDRVNLICVPWNWIENIGEFDI